LHSARLFEADSLSATQAYAYDADGNMIRDVHLDSKGDTSSSITLEYDGAGRETRRVIVFDDRSFLPMDIRTGYDAMGKVDTVKYYEEHPQFKWFEVYTYRNVSVPVPIRRFLAGQKAAHPELTAFNPGRDVLGRADDASGFARARYPSHPGAPRN
jgi:hypothetical protein